MTPPPAAAAAIPATRPAPARRGAPATPSRRSVPSTPARRSRPRRLAAPGRAPGHAAQAAAALAPSRLLERLIRSRSWIGLVAFALIGIVAMQLWLLKLNGGIGRAIEHEGMLERTNAALSAENSSMAAGDLIEQQAVASGMRIVAPGSLIFLRTHGSSDERLAAARLARPVQTPSAEGISAAVATFPSQSTSTAAATSPSQSTGIAAPAEGGSQTTTPSTSSTTTGAEAPAPTTSTAPSAPATTAVGGASAPTNPPAPETGG